MIKCGFKLQTHFLLLFVNKKYPVTYILPWKWGRFWLFKHFAPIKSPFYTIKMNEKRNRKEGRLVSRKYEKVRSSTIMLRKNLDKSSKIKTYCWHSPGVTAIQLILQPDLEVKLLVLNTSLTMLLVLIMLSGREEPILWSPIRMLPSEVEPQLFSIKVVPSPSVIVRWSKQAMSNAVNRKERISPCSTWIVSVFLTLFR